MMLATGGNEQTLAEGRGVDHEKRKVDSGLRFHSKGIRKDSIQGNDDGDGVGQREVVKPPHEEGLDELGDLGFVDSAEVPSAKGEIIMVLEGVEVSI
jgi:hypothetical protein